MSCCENCKAIGHPGKKDTPWCGKWGKCSCHASLPHDKQQLKEEGYAQAIVDIFFDAGARVSKEHFDKTLTLLRTHAAAAVAGERERCKNIITKNLMKLSGDEIMHILSLFTPPPSTSEQK